MARWVFSAVLLVLGNWAQAQELSIIHNFPGSNVATDGSTPNSSPVRDSAGNIYGTTASGGSTGQGTVYKLAPDGTVTILHSFGAHLTVGPAIIADGTSPIGSLILAADGNLYGTTASGGADFWGIVYRLSTTGTYTILHSFGVSASDSHGDPVAALGAYPEAGVIQGWDGNFYGTTSLGGNCGVGVVFQLKWDGTYTIIHQFTTNGDAACPGVGLVQDAHGYLYGVSETGGLAGTGAIYQIDPQFGYSLLYNFPAPTTSFNFSLASSYCLGRGNYSPNSSLVVGADGNLYGTAASTFVGAGAVYSVTPQGTFTLLHPFGDGSVANDSAEPVAFGGGPSLVNPLVLATDGNFYGVTPRGGSGKSGTLFAMTPGGQVTILHSFADGTVSSDGSQPVGLIQSSDGNFYGATSTGGSSGYGTAFKITAALPLFTSPLRVAAPVGAPFTYQMAATQGPNIYSVGALPPGFDFDGASVIFATPTASMAGVFTVNLTATNASGSASVPMTITVQSPPVITSLLSVVGSASGLAYKISATQNPTAFTAIGLPPGVSIDPATGIFYGLPTSAGMYEVTISATNPAGTATALVTMKILGATPTSSQQHAQLHAFPDGSVIGDGSYPGPMTLGRDSILYGVTGQGGATGDGTIFSLSPAGTEKVLANLGGANGSDPQGVIQAADGTLFGTTATGGSANEGTIFKVTPDGTINLLHTFGDNTVTNDGSNPQSGLVLASNGNFYGTTQYGGSAGQGTVFQMTPSGVVTIVHSFGAGLVPGPTSPLSTVTDGVQPVAALTQATGLAFSSTGPTVVLLAGTTLQGGAHGDGTLFTITSDGKLTLYHSFGDPTVTAGDGQLPRSPVTFQPPGTGSITGWFYGTTTTGGSIGKGTIYGLNLNGAQVSILHSFGDGTIANDGENPTSPLVVVPTRVSGGNGLYLNLPEPTLYGTTQNGGTAGAGTVFCYGPTIASATTFGTTILHNFGDSAFANDGTIPLGGVCLGADGNLYGTTTGGGSAGAGTAYDIEVNQVSAIPVLPLVGGWTCTGSLPPGMTFDSTTGTLSGSPASSAVGGSYALTITQYSLGTVQSTQTITLNLTQTFASWMAHTLGTSSTAATTGSDGVPLMLKYLFDISPSKPMTAIDHAAMPAAGLDTTTIPGTNFVTLTFRRNAAMTDVLITLESSDDLQTWSTVPPANLMARQVGTDGTTGDPVMEMGAKSDGAAQQFVRLKVTAP